MKRPQTLTERLLKGGAVVLLFAFVTSPIGYLIRMLYSRTLSIELYGLFYAVLAIFGLIAAYNDLGFGFSVSYLVPKFIKKKNYTKAWNVYKYDQIIEVGTSIILSIILILSAPWLATTFFKVPEAKNLIYVFTLYLISGSFVSALEKFFTGLQLEKYYSSIQFLRLFLTLIFSSFFWLRGNPTVLYYALSWSAAYISLAMLYYVLLRKKQSYLISRVTWDNKLFKKMATYALPTLITTTVGTLFVFTDTFLLTLFRGMKDVGVYNIVLPLASISGILLNPLNQFLLPLVSRLMEGEKEKVERLSSAILKLLPFAGLYFALFIALFPSSTTKFAFGQKWVGLIETPLTIFALGYIAVLVTNYLNTLIGGMGLAKERLKIVSISTTVKIGLSIALVFKYGVVGVLIANIVAYLLTIAFQRRLIKNNKVFLTYPFLYYLKLIAFAAISFLLVKTTNICPSSLFQFVLYVTIYTLIFFSFGLLIKAVDVETIKIIIRNRSSVNKT